MIDLFLIMFRTYSPRATAQMPKTMFVIVSVELDNAELGDSSENDLKG